jgi:hypothetical protein
LTQTIRYEIQSTTASDRALASIISDPNTREVCLFGTVAELPNDGIARTEPYTNLPLLAAIVWYKIPHVTELAIVFDGNLLTATRDNRAAEMAEVIDAALSSHIVFFGDTTVPLTSQLSPAAAVEVLVKAGLSIPLRPETFAAFKRLVGFRGDTKGG